MKCRCAFLARLELRMEALSVIRVGQRALARVSCVERNPVETSANSIVVVGLVSPNIS